MIKLAIIGTGGMANVHAEKFTEIKGCKVTAACDVDAERVGVFAKKHKIGQTFIDLDELFKSGDFDAVANVTPDRFHASISLQALEHGKHVLCEKPLAVHYPDAAKMALAAEKAGVIHMVNFSYRNSSAIQKAHKLVSAGALGRIIHVEGSYLQSWLSQNAWGDWRTSPGWLWRLSTSHGSKGVLGDVGVHLLDFASFPVGAMTSIDCTLHTFAKAPEDKVGDYVLDANDSAIITVRYEGGALGSLRATRWATGHHNSISLSLFGEEGALKIDLDKSYKDLEICKVKNRAAGAWITLPCGESPSIYQRFITSIKKGVNDQPDFARGAAIQKALDACEQSHLESRTVSL